MYKETNIRSIVKGLSWRLFATTATIIIVYIFFRRLDLAIAAGIIETIFKVVLYWAHERVWFKIKWGIKRIKPFNLWFTGLPLSLKSEIADKVYLKLEKLNIPIERIDSQDIREMIPIVGDNKEDRAKYIKRVIHLIKTLQSNSISTITSSFAPYDEAKNLISDMIENNIIVFIKTDLSKFKEDKDLDLKNKDNYKIPDHVDIFLNMEEINVESAADEIVSFIKKNSIK